MEMEHINENTIRVIINDNDLEERGITMLDLLGNQRQIESFFYSILEEVDIDDSFRENDMITFQVVPSKKGLELYISKDEGIMDTPYAKMQNFQQQAETGQDFSSEDFHWIGGQAQEEADKELEDTNFSSDQQKESVFEFQDIDQAILFAQHVSLENGLSFLFHMNNRYYICLIQFTDELPDYFIQGELAQAIEFGDLANYSYLSLKEHGQELIEGNALQMLRKYFD